MNGVFKCIVGIVSDYSYHHIDENDIVHFQPNIDLVSIEEAFSVLCLTEDISEASFNLASSANQNLLKRIRYLILRAHGSNLPIHSPNNS